ncbi:MAG TPA: GAF domain-containing protein [Candidatus Hydrogenedentes bacterium]|nr:GAF domain-containing protein [Candidatus Hydrogenedentota bacterium]
MSAQSIHVLLVDDEESVRTPLAQHLEKTYKYVVKTAANARDALSLLRDSVYDVALIDQILDEETDSRELIQNIKANYPETQIIVLTGWAMDEGISFLRMGAYRYLAKPFNLEELAITIQFAVEETRVRQGRQYLEDLISNSFDAVISLDSNKRITVFNKQAEKMFGYTADEMLGNTITKLYSNIDEAKRVWEIVNQQQKIVSHEVTLKHRNGAEIPTLLSAVSVRDSEGNVIGQAAFIRDLRQVYLLEDRLRALIKAGQAIGSLLEIDQILQLIMDSAVAAFPSAEKGSIHLFDQKTESLHIKASYGYSVKVNKALTLRIGEGFAGWVYEHGEPLVSSNAWEDKRFKASAYPEMQLQKSMICTPLKVKGKVIGTLSLDNLSTLDAFTHDDVGLLSTFAGYAANAIDNARLFQETKVAREKIRASFEASNTLVLSQPSIKLLEDIILQTQKAAGASWVSLVFIDELGFARNLFTTGSDNKVDMEKVVRPDGITMQVMRTGRIEVIENTKQQRGHVNPRMFRNKVASALCLPFTVQGKQIGVVWIHYSEPRHFPNYEVEALQLFVNQAAVAYDNARRVEELDYMRKATEAMASSIEPSQVLQQIVKSASEVLKADSAVLWSFDSVRNQFIIEEMVGFGIPIDVLEKFRKNEPEKGHTTDNLLEKGWIEVTDTLSPRLDFMGSTTKEFLSSIGVKSFQGIALMVGDEKLGVLYCNYNHPRSFTTEDRRTLETFANHAALALKRSRLLEQVGKARDSARVVAQVSVLEDLPHTLNAIVRGTQEALGCDAVTLYTYDQKRDEFSYPPAMIGVMNPAEVIKLDQVSDQSVVRKILALDNIYESENVQSDPLIKGTFASREQIKSTIGIPLRVGDSKVGVMFINYRTYHRFTADETTNIELFANQAAVAIRNAQLHDETERRAKALAGLYQSGQAITSTLAVGEVLSRITEQALSIVGVRSEGGCFSYIALLIKSTNKLRFIATSPIEMFSKFSGIEIDLANESRIGIAGRAIKTLMSQTVSDVRKDDDYIAFNPNTVSHLSVPLKIGDRAIGVLSIEHPRRSAFSIEDVRNVELLASQAAIAIQNAQSFEELRRTKELVGARTALAWMGMVSNTWQHAITQRAYTISNGINILRRELAKRSKSEAIDKQLDEIELSVKKIREIPITAPLSAEDGTQSVPVNALVREHAMQLWTNERYKNVSLKFDLQVEDTVTVRGSPEWLRRVLDIIVDNAVDAVAGQRKATVIIGSEETSTDIKVLVSDNGHGIPSDLLPQLFIAPVQKSVGSKGAGIGLLLARTIVETYGGTVLVQSTGAKGTTIAIILPKGQIEDQKIELSQPHSIGFAPIYDEIKAAYGDIKTASPSEYELLFNELKRKNEELRELDRKKNEFLSTVSHELRSPLTSIQSCIENLLSGMYGFLTEKQRSRLDVALAGVRDESRLIANLLDLARIQEGKKSLDLAPANICKIIHDVVTIFQYDTAQKGIMLAEDFSMDEIPEITVDAGKN